MEDYNNEIQVELQEFMGSDRAIADAAWTSSSELITKQAKTVEDVSKIVHMLADLKHSVPFESVVFRFWIKLPIALDRQHMTHRIASHSGMSGRYRTMPSTFLSMPDDVSSILDKVHNSGLLQNEYSELCTKANNWYQSTMANTKSARDNGKIDNAQYKRAREFLRGVLPQHNMTERVTVMNLRSFSNYYKLRAKADAQPEIQFIARKMFQCIVEKDVCPIAFESLDKNDWII
tara:strand:- start:194019 stop:194717 length:699 start_codon:yes stop_codon:yes gene_type:complete